MNTSSGMLAEAPTRPAYDDVSLCWLGQAGFLFRHAGRVILIDPYLSDTLATRYRGRVFDHVRLVPPPMVPDELDRADLVLCTHRHGDHMDPGTLLPIAARFPACRFVVPAAEMTHATNLGLPSARLVPAVAGVPLAPLAGLAVLPVPAAHEQRERNGAGHDRYLGFGLVIGRARIYHSGDCIPFPELVDAVRPLRASVALLPVNGRDAARAAAGVPGNFTLDEAVALCRATGIATMVAHHWGLFAFNTIAPDTIDAAARETADRGPRIMRPELGRDHLLA